MHSITTVPVGNDDPVDVTPYQKENSTRWLIKFETNIINTLEMVSFKSILIPTSTARLHPKFVHVSAKKDKHHKRTPLVLLMSMSCICVDLYNVSPWYLIVASAYLDKCVFVKI